MPPPIRISSLNFSYGSSLVLKDVNIEIYEREFISVVGPNGGGKSTLLKLILGLLKKQSGEISVYGNSPAIGRAQIGYLPQYANIDSSFPVTVLDTVLMGRLGKTRSWGGYTKSDRVKALKMLERVGLESFRNRPLSALSGGQRQRVLIARALVSDPKLILLDEPASSLDDHVERELFDLLKELNKDLTIIVVSHDIAYVSRYVERVICVNKVVHSHPVSDIDENLIHNMYGEHVHAVRHDQEHKNG